MKSSVTHRTQSFPSNHFSNGSGVRQYFYTPDHLMTPEHQAAGGSKFYREKMPGVRARSHASAASVCLSHKLFRVTVRAQLSRKPSTLIWFWILTRTAAIILAIAKNLTTGDVRYYYKQAQAHSLTDGLIEYPFPIAVGLMAPAKVMPWLVYDFAFAILALCVDAAAVYAWYRVVGRQAAWRWAWLIALIGPLAFYRFDIYVSAALCVLLLAVARRPVASGLAVAAGFGVKLWPAIFGFGFVGDRRTRLRHMGAALAGGVGLMAITALAAGPERIISPLKWQGERGFQTESFLSSIFGLRYLVGDRLELGKRNGSWEYVDASLQDWTWMVQAFSKLGYVAALSVLVLLIVLANRHRALAVGSHPVDAEGTDAATTLERERLAMGMTAVISILLITSPVLSPQYLLWLIPSLVLVPSTSLRRLGYLAMALSQLNLPIMFSATFSDHDVYAAALRLILFVRNAALLAIAVLATHWLVQQLRAQRSRASSSQTSLPTPE